MSQNFLFGSPLVLLFFATVVFAHRFLRLALTIAFLACELFYLLLLLDPRICYLHLHLSYFFVDVFLLFRSENIDIEKEGEKGLQPEERV